MIIELVAVGTRPPAWVEEGFREYESRLPRDWDLRLREIPVARRSGNTNVGKLKAIEADKMLAAIRNDATVIALDTRGAAWSTAKLAQNLGRWREESQVVQFLVGGPDGHDDRVLARANATWSLSNLTFPHFLVRIILAEQIYRAWAILNNHPYHK